MAQKLPLNIVAGPAIDPADAVAAALRHVPHAGRSAACVADDRDVIVRSERYGSVVPDDRVPGVFFHGVPFHEIRLDVVEMHGFRAGNAP